MTLDTLADFLETHFPANTAEFPLEAVRGPNEAGILTWTVFLHVRTDSDEWETEISNPSYGRVMERAHALLKGRLGRHRPA